MDEINSKDKSVSGVETAAIVAKAFSGIAPSAFSKFTESVGGPLNSIRSQFESTFSSHLASTVNRCSYVKTLFSKGEPADINSVYVGLRLKNDRKIINDVDIIDNHFGHIRTVIVGTGGAGKSMVLKYLAQKLATYSNGTVPIFIELRDLQDHIPADFYRSLLAYIVNNPTAKQISLFEAGLRSGIFTIFLDGLDEVAPDRRGQVYKSIQRIAVDFPDTKIIASTRPELNLSSWDVFSRYSVEPLDQGQISQLISRVDFDPIIKQKFAEAVKGELSETHKSFLGIPLLCSLMLLTYADNLSIPTKATQFYEQAFDTLQLTHDRKKGYYKRTYSCSLDEDQFVYLLSAICFRSLAKGDISFLHYELLRHISGASAACGLPVDPKDVAEDLVSSICLLIEDGLKLHFIHRSFQEFFAAKFALRYRSIPTFEMFNMLTTSLNNKALSMAAELDIQTVEKEWVLPTLMNIIDVIGTDATPSNLKKLINYFVESVDIFLYDDKIELVDWHGQNNLAHVDILNGLQGIYSDSFLLPVVFRFIDSLLLDEIFIRKYGKILSSVETDTVNKEIYSIRVSNIPVNWFKRHSEAAEMSILYRDINELYVKVSNRVRSYTSNVLLD